MDSPNTKPYNLPSDAVWFVTGCSSGIGQALAKLVASTPNRVVATARKAASLSSIPTNDRVLKLELDVANISSINAAIQATLDRFGRIDVLVNNAGYTLAGEAEATGDAEARDVFDTNFWGMVNISKRCLQIMREENAKNGQQGGVIMNVTSVGGYIGFPGQAFYHASKFAVEGWTEAVAKEVPSTWNIHLCNIEPGGVKTNYATSSLKKTAVRHKAYSDPNFPANMMLAHIGSEQGRALWAEPSAIAAAMYHVVSRRKRIPIRVPLGADSWGLIDGDLKNTKGDLDEIKDISYSVGDPKQLESIHFLK
ncbi:short-chain dehydrogenase [Annulohypoxylon maeteangense]|uniref:short-chain dehydrogenase n=1 Tax=Annulohypoxylon maeteangense TaxID=1927788 RepID=UPI00200748A5|nr:short-chain dehydrogenase [Annulohypoxylon maeteangense]KAI0882905.1 short-chain dehydrogenase [Annulohypoxylon maeteangense]